MPRQLDVDEEVDSHVRRLVGEVDQFGWDQISIRPADICDVKW